MRYVGISLMAASVMGIGLLAGERWSERLHLQQLLRQMMYHLKNQILYANEALPDALRTVGKRFSEAPGVCFCRISERMLEERNQSFAEIWEDEVERLAGSNPLSSVDQENLVQLGRQLGYADREMQERILLLYLEETDDSIVYLKKEADIRKKLYRSLGVAGGLFLAVFLL